MSQSELLHARAGYFYFCLSKSKLDACCSERREKTNQTAHKNNLNYVFGFFQHPTANYCHANMSPRCDRSFSSSSDEKKKVWLKEINKVEFRGETSACDSTRRNTSFPILRVAPPKSNTWKVAKLSLTSQTKPRVQTPIMKDFSKIVRDFQLMDVNFSSGSSEVSLKVYNG